MGKLFEFFEKEKDRLNIQQYTIKQASVEQIFNKFAEIAEETEYNGWLPTFISFYLQFINYENLSYCFRSR